MHITYGSNIVKPFSLKFSYSIYGSIILAISVPYLSTCLSNLSLLLLVFLVSDTVMEIPENDLWLFITFLFIFYSKSIRPGRGDNSHPWVVFVSCQCIDRVNIRQSKLNPFTIRVRQVNTNMTHLILLFKMTRIIINHPCLTQITY